MANALNKVYFVRRARSVRRDGRSPSASAVLATPLPPKPLNAKSSAVAALRPCPTVYVCSLSGGLLHLHRLAKSVIHSHQIARVNFPPRRRFCRSPDLSSAAPLSSLSLRSGLCPQGQHPFSVSGVALSLCGTCDLPKTRDGR